MYGMILDSPFLMNLNEIYFNIYFMKNILFLSKHNRKQKRFKNIALQLTQKLQADMHYWSYKRKKKDLNSNGDYKKESLPRSNYLKSRTEQDKKFKVRIMTLLTYSISIQALKEYLLDNSIDLVVLDPGNIKYIEDLLVEYDPEDNDNLVECPILIIRGKTDNFCVDNILTIFSYLHDEHINIKVLKSIADAYDSKIHLLYIVHSAKKETDKELESLETIAQNNHLNNYSANILVNEAIEDGISSFSRRRNANIIALIGFDQLSLIELNKNLLELKGPMQFSVFELVKF
jgi:hypothetical protein